MGKQPVLNIIVKSRVSAWVTISKVPWLVMLSPNLVSQLWCSPLLGARSRDEDLLAGLVPVEMNERPPSCGSAGDTHEIPFAPGG